MLGSLAQAGTKALGGERFSLVNVLPATLLVGYVSFLAISGVYAGRNVSINDIPKVAGRNPGWAILAVVVIFVTSFLLRPFQMALVWILEGYWQSTPLLRSVAPWAVERHVRRRHTSDVTESRHIPEPSSSIALAEVVAERIRVRREAVVTERAARILKRYPADRPVLDEDDLLQTVEVRIMPTGLGNILRKAEDDSGYRYGLSLPDIAPRLYAVLPEKISKEIVRSLDLIEAGAAVSTASSLAALASLPLLARADLWAVAPLIAIVLAIFAYSGTLRTAQGHGRLLATAVDLYRFDMLAKLHYRLPTTVDEEWDFNVDLSNFFSYGDQLARDIMSDYSYVHPEKNPEPPTSSDGASSPPAKEQAAD